MYIIHELLAVQQVRENKSLKRIYPTDPSAIFVPQNLSTEVSVP